MKLNNHQRYKLVDHANFLSNEAVCFAVWILFLFWFDKGTINVRLQSPQSLSDVLTHQPVNATELPYMLEVHAQYICQYTARNQKSSISNLKHWNLSGCMRTDWFDMPSLVNITTQGLSREDLIKVPQTVIRTKASFSCLVVAMVFCMIQWAIQKTLIKLLDRPFTTMTFPIQVILRIVVVALVVSHLVIKQQIYSNIEDFKFNTDSFIMKVQWLSVTLHLGTMFILLVCPWWNAYLFQKEEKERLEKYKDMRTKEFQQEFDYQRNLITKYRENVQRNNSLLV